MKQNSLDSGAIISLEDTLSSAFWYKKELRHFLRTSGINQELLVPLDWSEYKRNIVAHLVGGMATHANEYGEDLITLAIAVCEIGDPTWLLNVQGNGKELYADAVHKLNKFNERMAPLLKSRSSQEKKADQQNRIQQKLAIHNSMSKAINQLATEFKSITELPAQQRGYRFEKFIVNLFQVFDIETHGSYKTSGEQIDGSFTLDNTDYLLEAKWQSQQIDEPDIAFFISKVNNKLDNTLGLFISMNGFTKRAIENFSKQRPNVLLMDGFDFAAVLEQRIELPTLITGKRIHAAQTGEIMFSAYRIMCS